MKSEDVSNFGNPLFPNCDWGLKNPKDFSNLKHRILDEKAPNPVSRASPKSWKEFGPDWRGLRQDQILNLGKIPWMGE